MLPRRRLRTLEPLRQITAPDALASAEHDQLTCEVLKLANVARPVVQNQRFVNVLADRRHVVAVTGKASEKMA